MPFKSVFQMGWKRQKWQIGRCIHDQKDHNLKRIRINEKIDLLIFVIICAAACFVLFLAYIHDPIVDRDNDIPQLIRPYGQSSPGNVGNDA